MLRFGALNLLPVVVPNCYAEGMGKSSKADSPKLKRDASSGQFVVLKPAVRSKLKIGQIRAAVRKVNEAQGAK